ncbi:2-polyprenyl-6-methoxyphenol hydroxylase-like FAD-dependent oxidoreductase [Nocardiopsis mwathae]|uniref:2-polyprenyl-6-methoxyphenol hydroxylase-like FAD-dependent oxidoreductase n=1 Tax=Nocardiopsis mwathae TaxID=1472723 RepID=A0A7X0D573_9ACTN|nr:styrene monooxygenase/indole monooxygenase family protein [Nocardiopsis mwathae]MBB6171905.1 2-polyprenyl-6-methoxyphenol hydroxylase-like FAD-dependent oxidoreductase [Nocardiopsis mwathae]
MRRILIVGAGQSGLQMAIGLLADDYDVTLVSLHSPEEIRAGRVLSTQCLFGAALRDEHRHGLDTHNGAAPPIGGVGVGLADAKGGLSADWTGRLREPARSVDQRLKMAAWLEEVERRGGRILIHRATVEDLDRAADSYDLVVVATGRGELGELFERDGQRSEFAAPQRTLTAAYVHGMAEHAAGSVLRRNVLPGVGEILVTPSYTLGGPCHAITVEAVPGGPMDTAPGSDEGAEAMLARVLEAVRRHTPWEYERCRGVELTDGRAVLQGAVTPVVRKPVGRLPGGAAVLAMGDAVVTNDPVTSQGANSAAQCAKAYRRAIVDHGDRPFDAEFMRSAFDGHWQHARHVVAWSKVMLRMPPHVQELLQAAQYSQETADRFANGFADPADFIGWFLHPRRASEYLTSLPISV